MHVIFDFRKRTPQRMAEQRFRLNDADYVVHAASPNRKALVWAFLNDTKIFLNRLFGVKPDDVTSRHHELPGRQLFQLERSVEQIEFLRIESAGFGALIEQDEKLVGRGDGVTLSRGFGNTKQFKDEVGKPVHQRYQRRADGGEDLKWHGQHEDHVFRRPESP